MNVLNFKTCIVIVVLFLSADFVQAQIPKDFRMVNATIDAKGDLVTPLPKRHHSMISIFSLVNGRWIIED